MSNSDHRSGTDSTRRRILNWFLGTSLGALLASALYPVARFLVPPPIPEATTFRVEVGPIDDPELVEKGCPPEGGMTLAGDDTMRHSEPQTASAAQSREALARLVDNRRHFLAFLQRRLGDPQAAEELLQAAYLRGVEHVGELRQDESVLAWFYRLLRNALVDHWRQRSSEQRGFERLARELGDARVPAPEVEAELCRCFESELVDLPEGYAEIVRRIDLQGQRPVDFAADHGITANNAMVRLHRARRALRDRLLNLCGACAEHGCLDCGCGSGAADRKGGGGLPSA